MLSSQNQVLLAQTVRAQLQARRLTFSVDLVRALGGGYARPPAEVPLAENRRNE